MSARGDRALVAFATLIAVAILGIIGWVLWREAGGGGDPSVETGDGFTVSGVLELGPAGSFGITGGCEGSGGYSDITAGAQVVVRDGDGTKVGLGVLGPGAWGGGGSGLCVFPFNIQGVPSGGGVYSVEVAGRGEVAFTEDDAEDVVLTLG